MKIIDFITKIGEDINIKMVENGFLLEVSGRNAKDDWNSVKLVCKSEAELNALLSECFTLPREN